MGRNDYENDPRAMLRMVKRQRYVIGNNRRFIADPGWNKTEIVDAPSEGGCFMVHAVAAGHCRSPVTSPKRAMHISTTKRQLPRRPREDVEVL